jgi:hypothetical protein
MSSVDLTLPDGWATHEGHEGGWYRLHRGALGALKGTGFRADQTAGGGRVVLNAALGPRKGERLQLLEALKPTSEGMMVSVAWPEGAGWPDRTRQRVQAAYAALEASLPRVAAMIWVDQPAGIVAALTEARDLVPVARSAGRRKRTRGQQSSIRAVSGGLPSLGKRR